MTNKQEQVARIIDPALERAAEWFYARSPSIRYDVFGGRVLNKAVPWGDATPDERTDAYQDAAEILALFAPVVDGSEDAVVADIDREMEGRGRGHCDERGELLFRARDEISRLSAELVVSRAVEHELGPLSHAALVVRADAAEAALGVARDALTKIAAIKPEAIGDTGFTTGPLVHFNAAKEIAAEALTGTGGKT